MAARSQRDPQTLVLIKDTLRVLPWWAGIPAVAATYACFRWLIPGIMGLFGAGLNTPLNFADMIGGMTKLLAPLLAVVVGIVWIGTLVSRASDRRRLDQQSGIESIRRLPWREFELLLSAAFRRQGYRVTDTGETHGNGPDGGVDLILHRDQQTTLVQCKQWKSRRVGVGVARELFGVVASRQADRGMVVTSGGYTREAEDFARNLPLQLIDGLALEQLIRSVQRAGPASHNPARTQAGPGDPAQPTRSAPACPACGSTMTRRLARKGPHAGQRFWGCPEFPRCRGTRSLQHESAERTG